MTRTLIWSESVWKVGKKFTYANYLCICYFSAFFFSFLFGAFVFVVWVFFLFCFSFSFFRPVLGKGYHKVFWGQFIWKGSHGHNTKVCSNEISSSNFPNLGHLHIGNFTGIQTGVNWIQNLHHETWDTSWTYWPYAAFVQTLSARTGRFG